MIRFRPFRNSDPPRLAEMWRACARKRGLVQPLTVPMFEQLVLAKPYFDHRGLIVAEGEQGLVGFVHAGFGPDASGQSLSTATAALCMLVVRSDHRRESLGTELLARAEEYAWNAGSGRIYFGGAPWIAPFYLGLYGGSRLPGVLDSDPETVHFVTRNAYQAAGRRLIHHRDLGTFRPLVDRKLLAVRRRATFDVRIDPPARNWWDACTLGCFEQVEGLLLETGTDRALARCRGWRMDPLAQSWGVHAVGLTDLDVAAEQRRQGLATYLLSELFRQLQALGISLVEIQLDHDQASMLGVVRKLGFAQVDAGTLYVKAAPLAAA